MSGNCGATHTFDGSSSGFRRALLVVIGINALMFGVEMLAGTVAQSQALKADALDFLADTLTYGLSLWVIGKPQSWRTNAARLKGYSLLLMGVMVFSLAVWRAVFAAEPQAELMGGIALLALAANLASVFILVRWKDGDANVRSVWLCSRNDAIGNVAVFVSAAAVWLTGTHWPDIIVALGMSGLFVSSALQILHKADEESRSVPGH
jgi:cation diffusion facilitator family transporter